MDCSDATSKDRPSNLVNKFVLSIKPEEYLKQGPSHCGVYSVKAILSAYGLDTKTHPKYYHTNLIGRFTGTTLGRQYYRNILNIHGVDAETKTAEGLTDEARIHLLKKLLSKNTPVMLRIGNGYASDTYNPLLGRIIGHWITLWGYDDSKKLFYIYDSGLPEKHWDKNFQIGNTTRTYKEILRDWRFGRWQPHTWLLVGRTNYLFIEIKGATKT